MTFFRWFMLLSCCFDVLLSFFSCFFIDSSYPRVVLKLFVRLPFFHVSSCYCYGVLMTYFHFLFLFHLQVAPLTSLNFLASFSKWFTLMLSLTFPFLFLSSSEWFSSFPFTFPVSRRKPTHFLTSHTQVFCLQTLNLSNVCHHIFYQQRAVTTFLMPRRTRQPSARHCYGRRLSAALGRGRGAT